MKGDQDPRERREIRHQYRKLMQETDEKREELSDYKNLDKLEDLLDRGDAVHKKVSHTREAALDCQLMVGIAGLTVCNARALPVDFVNFLPAEYAEKLVTFATDGNSTSMTKESWINFGRMGCTQICKRSPSLKYLFGSFERDAPKRKEVVRKKPQEKEKEKDKEIVKPTQVENTSELGRKEVTTEEVDSVLAQLKRLYNLNNGIPICYFEFITDPKSFGHTVENMFHVAFLVKDGHCRVFLDEEKLPVIEPILHEQDKDVVTNQEKQQVIISMTPEQWQEIVETFRIKSAVLHRSDSRNTQNSPNKRRKTKK